MSREFLVEHGFLFCLIKFQRKVYLCTKVQHCTLHSLYVWAFYYCCRLFNVYVMCNNVTNMQKFSKVLWILNEFHSSRSHSPKTILIISWLCLCLYLLRPVQFTNLLHNCSKWLSWMNWNYQHLFKNKNHVNEKVKERRNERDKCTNN